MSKPFAFKNTEKNDFRLSVQAKSTTHAEMEMYGVVGGDWFGEGIVAKDVIAKLKDLPSSIKTLDLRINSPGGSVTEGMAIYNRLKEYGKKVKITAHVDALSASIASIIMLGAEEIQMGDAGFVMIHKPWTYTSGNSDDLEKAVSILDDIENQMINLYMKKTKLSRIEIKDMLQKETWMDAATAKEYGFIDTIKDQELQIAACVDPKLHWMASAPKTLTTQATLAKKKATELENKINKFLAR